MPGTRDSFAYERDSRHSHINNLSGKSGDLQVAAAPNSVPAPIALTDALGPGQYQVGYNGYGPVDTVPIVELYRDATFELGFYRQVDQVRTNEVISVRDMVGLPIASLQAPTSPQFTQEVYQYDSRFLAPYLTNSYATIGNIQHEDDLTRNIYAELTGTESPRSDGVVVKNGIGHDAAGRVTGESH